MTKGRFDVLAEYEWTPDPRWDNKVLNYDLDRHNWSQYFLEAVQQLKPALKNLEDIHLHFKIDEFIDLRKHLEKVTNSRDFSQRLDAFFEEYAAPLLDDPNYLIQSTCGIRIVVPDQEKLGRLLGFHTGYWTGYSNKMGTIWTPLTRAFDTNTLQVMSWEETIPIMKRIHNEQLSIDEIQEICLEKSWPVNINPGQSWLFNQGHLHGGRNNETNITRVSFDARWALGDYGIRRPGSFFRFPGTHSEINQKDIKPGSWVAFLDSNSDYIGETPRYMIRDYTINYAKRLGIQCSEWSADAWNVTWMANFRSYAKKDTISGLVLPSIHAFSKNKDLCLDSFRLALNHGQQLLFVDENLLIKDHKDLEIVERYYQLAE